MDGSKRRGYSLIELALTFPVVLILIGAFADVTRVLSARSVLRESVDRGLRCIYPTDGVCRQPPPLTNPALLYDFYLPPGREPLYSVRRATYSAEGRYLEALPRQRGFSAVVLDSVTATARVLRASAHVQLWRPYVIQRYVILLERNPSVRGTNPREPSIRSIAGRPATQLAAAGKRLMLSEERDETDWASLGTYRMPAPPDADCYLREPPRESSGEGCRSDYLTSTPIVLWVRGSSGRTSDESKGKVLLRVRAVRSAADLRDPGRGSESLFLGGQVYGRQGGANFFVRGMPEREIPREMRENSRGERFEEFSLYSNVPAARYEQTYSVEAQLLRIAGGGTLEWVFDGADVYSSLYSGIRQREVACREHTAGHEPPASCTPEDRSVRHYGPPANRRVLNRTFTVEGPYSAEEIASRLRGEYSGTVEAAVQSSGIAPLVKVTGPETSGSMQVSEKCPDNIGVTSLDAPGAREEAWSLCPVTSAGSPSSVSWAEATKKLPEIQRWIGACDFVPPLPAAVSAYRHLVPEEPVALTSEKAQRIGSFGRAVRRSKRDPSHAETEDPLYAMEHDARYHCDAIRLHSETFDAGNAGAMFGERIPALCDYENTIRNELIRAGIFPADGYLSVNETDGGYTLEPSCPSACGGCREIFSSAVSSEWTKIGGGPFQAGYTPPRCRISGTQCQRRVAGSVSRTEPESASEEVAADAAEEVVYSTAGSLLPWVKHGCEGSECLRVSICSGRKCGPENAPDLLEAEAVLRVPLRFTPALEYFDLRFKQAERSERSFVQ